MSISSINSTVTNQYYSGLTSTLGTSGTNADYVTNLEQAAQDQTILAMDPSLAQTISQQTSSPQLVPSSQAIATLPQVGGNSAPLPQSSLVSLAYSMQLMQSLSASGTLTNNTSLAQALLQNYTSPTNISSGSVVNTSA